MNLARLPQPNPGHDQHRPTAKFWGPVKVGDEESNWCSALHAESLPNDVPKPSCCPICDSRMFQLIGIIYGYPIYNCLSCDVGWVFPMPDEAMLNEYYGPAYWSGYMQDERPLYFRQPLCDHTCKRQIEFLTRLVPERNARILDVGAGDGTNLRLLKDRGYHHLLGLEQNPENARKAHEQLGVNVLSQSFEQFNEPGWDVITLWAVIEHLREPLTYVRHAYELLKPGGLFLLMTGDNNSFTARLQGCFDLWLYPPEHLFFFGRRSLNRLLGSSGFMGVHLRNGCQAVWKESLLKLSRISDSAKRMLRKETRPAWRSSASNLLVAWGRK